MTNDQSITGPFIRPVSPLRDPRAFTLLEILVAVAMLALIMATVLGTFAGVMSGSRNAEKRAELCQTGRAVMDILCSDIRGFVPFGTPEGEVFFVGLPERAEGDEEVSRADFITTHTLPVGIERSPFLSEVGYRIRKDEKGALYSLWRRAQFPPEYPYEEGGKEVPLCRIIESFRLEFLYGNDISFRLVNAVPDAVILNFTLNLEGEREQFVTMVRPMIKG